MTHIEESDSPLITLLRAAIDDGKLKPANPVFMSTQFHYRLKGFGFWHQLIGYAPTPSEEEHEQIIESAADVLLNHYVNMRNSF